MLCRLGSFFVCRSPDTIKKCFDWLQLKTWFVNAQQHDNNKRNSTRFHDDGDVTSGESSKSVYDFRDAISIERRSDDDDETCIMGGRRITYGNTVLGESATLRLPVR